MAVVGVCAKCQQNEMKLRSSTDEELVAMARKKYIPVMEFVEKNSPECIYLVEEHNDPAGNPCEGANEFPDSYYNDRRT